jgi:hypothetical protein
MRTKLGVLLLAVVAVALVAAGCGGDDDDGEALTKNEFIAQGDENCARADAELEAAEREAFSGGEPSSAEAERFVTDDLLPNIQGQIDFLRNLNPPEADQDQVNEILDTAQEGVDGLEENPDEIEGGPAGEQLNQAGTELKEFGFEKCGG